MSIQNLSLVTSRIYKLLLSIKMQSLKYSISIITLILLLSFIGISGLNATNVKYSGFCFTGNYSDIPTNFQYTNMLIQEKTDNQSILDKEFSTFFQANSTFKNFQLVFGQATTEDKTSLALAMNREDVSFETIGGYTKAIYNVGCTIFILDFTEMKVLQSYPIKVAYIDLTGGKPSDETIKNTFHMIISEKITQQIKDKAGDIALRSANSRSMKIADVSFSDEVLPYLTVYKDKLDAYSSLIAQHVTECFAYQMNVTMLPYSKDYLGQKMSLAFTDASIQNFTIPTASYDIDVNISKLVKKLYKETKAERVDVFGAYVNLKIYDAELDTEYWNQEMKHGATKQIAAGQEVEDDFYNYNEVILATFSNKVIETMKDDKKLMKKVIAKCENY